MEQKEDDMGRIHRRRRKEWKWRRRRWIRGKGIREGDAGYEGGKERGIDMSRSKGGSGAGGSGRTRGVA
jgi:hypothetical protein